MDISAKEESGLTVLSVNGRVDASNTREFEAGCAPHVREGARVVLDFQGLDYLSSAGLRSILLLSRQLKDLQGGLAIAGLNGMVKEVFALTGCDTMMPVFRTPEEAAGGEWPAASAP